ncbi:pyridoxal phosphate-dependent decarboxylase family protein [Streptomyces sp. NPDC054796]
MPAYAADPCLLAGGTEGPAALRPLTDTVLDALFEGAAERAGPLPAGGPERVAERVREGLGTGIPERGTGGPAALRDLVRLLAEGAADPADPRCAAHLHCPPLAVATAADLAAGALNPSMDSWDQAPAASELEALTCRALAALVYGGRGDRGRRVGPAHREPGDGASRGGPEAPVTPGGRDGHAPHDTHRTRDWPGRPDALVTTGGTESNQLGVLLARERAADGRIRVVCGANAHHSVHRAAWLLGLPAPVVVPTPRGVLEPGALEKALVSLEEPAFVVATAGTTDTGDIDPLAELVPLARQYDALLHVDAAYGGPLLFSERLRPRLAGLEQADSVTFDLHKLGWQPVAAGLFLVPDGRSLSPLDHRADYLNADDDTEAGLPDLLGRSLRTTRRPDILKVAVTLRALGREGLAELVERTCEAACRFAELVAADARFELYAAPALSTVLFRPVGAGGETVAAIRRRLLAGGRAVLGRAVAGDGLWLKATLLNPHVRSGDLAGLLTLVHDAAAEGHPAR